jgi:membrane protein implicated in regulation of membrane protease activity
MPIAVLVTYSAHWVAVVLLVANAISFQLASVFASALTLNLAVLMWTFVRRVSTLLGDRVGEDWDPSRG